MTLEHPTYHTLVVDDESDVCYLFTIILRRRNTTISCASTLVEAKAELARQPTDILFLDGLGIDFITYVKGTYPLTKIIVISANDNVSNHNKAIESGAERFLSKPLGIEELDETIQQLYH